MKTLSGRNASQSEYELRAFIDFLIRHDVKKYCEIGARHGDTFFEIMKSLPAGSYGLAVDLPGGLWGTRKSQKALENAVGQVISEGRQADVIFGDSTDEKIIQRVQNKAPFDAILIDGDHTFKGVVKDWKNYGKLGKIIAFHDIVGTGQKEKVKQSPVEVPVLWEVIKKSYPGKTFEFIAEGSKMGIGCVLM